MFWLVNGTRCCIVVAGRTDSRWYDIERRVMINIEDVQGMTEATIPVRDAAEVLGCDRRTVYRGIEDGTIPGIKIGRRVMILRIPFLRMLTGETAGVAA